MFSDPQAIIDSLELSPESIVADFGAGSGFYSLATGRVLSAGGGKVYAIDVQKELLERIKTLGVNQGIHNIEVVWGDIEAQKGSKLKDGLADWVIVANLLFQVPEKLAVITEAKRVLKARGRLLVVDWAESFGGTGPTPTDVVTESVVKTFGATAGLIFEKKISAGEHHYGLIFRKMS
jgi:ubiquinone/menaquinone biosynthesis C-methylase UbiE